MEPLDIALRRLTFGVRDLQEAWVTTWGWVQARLPSRRAATTGERALSRLFEARRRGQARTTPEGASADPKGFSRSLGSAEDREPTEAEAPAPPAETADSLARLREAKRRARRR